MEHQASSPTFAADPDRATIQHYEMGGAAGLGEAVAIVDGDLCSDKRNATFSIRNEDHTLGNALRSIIMQNPAVDFCGYSIPHPSEAKIHLRIQSRGPPAIDILKKGRDDLHVALSLVREKFDASLAAGTYEHRPDVEV